jgi:hypothetical protein
MKAHAYAQTSRHPPQKERDEESFPAKHKERRHSARVKDYHPDDSNPVEFLRLLIYHRFAAHVSPLSPQEVFRPHRFDERHACMVATYSLTVCNSYVRIG